METLEILSKIEKVLTKDEMDQLYAYMESYRQDPPRGYILFPVEYIQDIHDVQHITNKAVELFESEEEMIKASELVKVIKTIVTVVEIKDNQSES